MWIIFIADYNYYYIIIVTITIHGCIINNIIDHYYKL